METFGKLLYKCGGCLFSTPDSGALHCHLESHPQGGSYYYNHVLKTAFPKYDYICAEVQTEDHPASTIMFSNIKIENRLSTCAPPLTLSQTGSQGFQNGEGPSNSKLNEQLQPVISRSTINDVANIVTVKVERESEDEFNDDTDSYDAETEINKTEKKRTCIKSQTHIKNQSKNKQFDINEKSKYRNLTLKFECLICKKDYRRKSDLKRHVVTTHADGYPLHCNCCSTPFVLESDQKKHKCKIKTSNMHKCFQCNKYFNQRDMLLEHMNDYHNNKFPITCETCFKPLASEEEKAKHLTKHKEALHEENQNMNKDEYKLRSEDSSYKNEIEDCAGDENGNEHQAADLKHEGDNLHLSVITERHPLNTGMYNCLACEAKYSKKRELGEHIVKSHASSYPIMCPHCSTPFVSKPDQMKHKCRKTPKVRHKCLSCDDISYIRKAVLLDHIREKHNNVIPLSCDVCSKPLVSELDKSRHMLLHNSATDSKLHECQTCGRVLSTSYSLMNHMRSHCGERPYKCDLCDRAFREVSQLRYHTKAHENQRKEICEHCGKGFNSRDKLGRHRRSCSKQFQCAICGNKFSDPCKVKSHMRTHTGEKPYICETCGFACSQPGILKRHVQYIHLKVRDHKCSMCDKRFVTLETLKRHIRVHNKVRPYICVHCGKAFSEQWNLKTHMHRHTGEKPYKCNNCGMAFRHNVVRKSHQNKCQTYRSQVVEQSEQEVVEQAVNLMIT